VQAALEAIDGVEPGDVAVTGDGPHTVAFGGLLANQDVDAITGVGGTNEVQTITLSGGIAGDTFTLTFDGHTTAPIAYDADSAAVQAALEAIDGVEPGDVAVTGDGPHTVAFGGLLANQDVDAITGEAGADAVQTVVLNGVTNGTFTLTFDGQTTANIAWDAASVDVQDALEGLSNVGHGDIEVTAGDPSGWIVTFTGALGHQEVATLTGDGTLLVGDPATISVTETGTGSALTVGVVETTPGNTLTVGVVETTPGNTLTVGVVETTPGNTLTVGVVETTPGNTLTVGVVETTPGNTATVIVTETSKGDPDGMVVATDVTTASTGCDFAWIAV
jgi:hypothetical protein